MTRGKIGWLTLAVVLAFGSIAAAQVNMDFKGADVRDVLNVLGQIGGFNVALDQGVQGEVTLQLKDIPVQEAIELVVKVSGYSSQWVGTNTLVVGSPERLKTQFTVTSTKVFPVRYANPTNLIPALQVLIESASIIPDPAGTSIIIRGTDEQLQFAENFIHQRDVAPPLTLDYTRGNVVEIFRALAKAGGYTLVADPAIVGELTFFYQGTNVLEAIKLVSQQSGIAYTIEGKQLILHAPKPAPSVVATVAGPGVAPSTPTVTITPPPEEVRIYRLNHITPQQARNVVVALIADNKVRTDDLNASLIVTATAEQLALVSSLIKQYDVPQIRVRGVVVQNNNRVVILEVDAETHVLAEGSRIAGYTVESIAFDEVVLVATNGERRTLSNWKGAK